MNLQTLWGGILVITGILVILQIPAKFESMGGPNADNIFAKFCFYLLAILLIGGGIKKIYHQFYGDKEKDENNGQ